MPEATSIYITGQRTISSPEHSRIRTEPIAWPNGAHVAVVSSVIFELFTNPTAIYRTEISKQSLFGGRRGIWRLLDQYDRHQVKASFLINGYAAERFTEAVVEVKMRGHEIVPYGYSTSRYLSDMKPDEEKAEIQKSLAIIEKITGKRPVGWVSPDLLPSDNTLEILAGEGIMWNGDFPSDDLPYKVQAGGKDMVVIPFGNEIDDYEIYGKNLQPPEVFAEYFHDALDVLMAEGETHPKMLNSTMRCHFFGRSVGTKAVDKTLQYGSSLPKVWRTTRTEIAEWWVKQKYS